MQLFFLGAIAVALFFIACFLYDILAELRQIKHNTGVMRAQLQEDAHARARQGLRPRP